MRVPWAVDPADERPPQLQVNLHLETDWMQDAMCGQNETAHHLMFSHDPPDMEKSKAFCGGCGVRSLCYAYAIVYGEQGVWGGTTEHEREDRRRFIVEDVIDLWPLLHDRWAGVERGEGSNPVRVTRESTLVPEKISPPAPLSAFDEARQRARERSGEKHGEHVLRRGYRRTFLTGDDREATHAPV